MEISMKLRRYTRQELLCNLSLIVFSMPLLLATVINRTLKYKDNLTDLVLLYLFAYKKKNIASELPLLEV